LILVFGVYEVNKNLEGVAFIKFGILSIVAFIMGWVYIPSLQITINNEGIEYNSIMRRYLYKKSIFIKWHEIIYISSNNYFYVGYIPKAIVIKGNCSGELIKIYVSNGYNDFKEVLLFIEKRVTSDIIDDDVKKLIEKFKQEEK
jgi:hypothetical protein